MSKILCSPLAIACGSDVEEAREAALRLQWWPEQGCNATADWHVRVLL